MYPIKISLLGIMIFTLLFYTGCKKQVTSFDQQNVEIKFIEGFVAVSLMPSTPPIPDPVFAQVTLLLKNKDATNPKTGIRIPQADIFLASNDEKLGSIRFTTEWDGTLLPAEQDTVQLDKIAETKPVVKVKRGENVYLRIKITLPNRKPIWFQTPALLFQSWE